MITYSPIFVLLHHLPSSYIYTLSLHDALPIYFNARWGWRPPGVSSVACSRSRCSERSVTKTRRSSWRRRSEEHTSERQSPCNDVCRLLLEKITIDLCL